MTPGLKPALQRGALIAAANWPLVVVQFVAESTLKLLLAVPIVGGAFLVALLIDTSLSDLLQGDVREMVVSIVSALTGSPAALVAFVLAFLLVAIGGSVMTFVVKGGTVAILAEAERVAGPIERPPLRFESVRRAAVWGIDPFVAGSTRLWRRYVRIGAGLLIVYVVTAALYLGCVLGGYALVGNSGILLGWTVIAAFASSALIVWITIVNFFYLMVQMVVAVEDVSVRRGTRLALAFVYGHLREVAAVFGVVLVFVVLATAASILATAGLGLIAFVPLVGLAVLPLQLAAWLVRGFVFEYIALAALGAYLSHYRWYQRGAGAPASLREIPGKRSA
ncbi:MAG TPA: hypothetical protein VFY79_01560 [Dehalococcoidia bacterium]|nr:hypothetical protein [Dehalococcoidia bacterium]